MTDTGVAAAGGTGQEIMRLGPMGIAISFKRPGVFVASRKNCTEVVLTRSHLVGVARPGCLLALFGRGGGPVFSVPLADVVGVERADFLANRAVLVCYRTAAGNREVAVIGALACHHHVERLWEALRRPTPAP